jgi:hypothetical protein
MLQLMHALQDEGLDHWRVVARAWNVDLPAQDPLDALLRGMLNPANVATAYHELPPDVQSAIFALRQTGGRIPMATFVHRFGELRAMGVARREREKPWLEPVSVTERLWYAGWIGRAFIRSGGTSQEYAFLPVDLAAVLPASVSADFGGRRLFSYQPAKEERILSLADRAAQDACTLLAFLRNRPQSSTSPSTQWKAHSTLERHLYSRDSVPLLVALLREGDILTGEPLQPDADTAPAFLEQSNREAAEFLRKAWVDSRWNDLEDAGQWTAEAGWPNDPVQSRRRFWDAFSRAPADEWCTLDSFTAALRETDWEFLRPASSFEEWMIRDRNGDFLRGMDSWDALEGAFARSLLIRPMAWLGIADLAPSESPQAFRRAEKGLAVAQPHQAATRTRWTGARIRVDGTILTAPDVALMLRYRLARCAEWIGRMGDVFIYRITPRSLARAASQEIHVDHILPLLRRLGGEVPPALGNALRRWEQKGVEVEVRRERLLLPKNPEAAARIMARLENRRGMIRPIEGPAWLVSPDSVRRVREALGEDGIFIDEEEGL